MNYRLFLLLLILPFTLRAQDLPKGLTPAEELLMKNYTPPVSTEAFTSPPHAPVRTMAEWEELEGIIITWTSYQSILRQIVDYAQDEGTVWIVCSDSNSVKNYITGGGVPLTNVKFIIASFNSIWVRDYGPWTIYNNNNDSLYLVDWVYNRPRPLDDQIPVVFGNYKNFPVYQTTTAPYKLIATGGNFMVDGLGTAFSSRLIVDENPTASEAQIDTILKKYMGVDRYIKMTNLPYDGIHHIDMHMKLLDEETILVGLYPNGVSDGPQIEANINYVQNNFLTPSGKRYRLVRVAMPPDGSGLYPSSGGDYRTFTNSVFVNKTVIVPTYAQQYDTTALRIYSEALPGYRIVGINSNQIIPASGAIHCITKEIGVKDPVHIVHFPLRDTIPVATSAGIPVDAEVNTQKNVNGVTLSFSVNGGGFTQTGMVPAGGTSYRGFITGVNSNDIVKYYITVNTPDRSINKPLPGEAGAYTFRVGAFLPVELTSFSASVTGETVTLSWSTATELNNKGFEVQRRKVWTTEEFSTIGFVRGAGTTSEITQYSFNDIHTGSGLFEYRLKQTDFDGTVSYSKIIRTEINIAAFALEQNYPNPFNPVTTISYAVPQPGFVSVKVFDIMGGLVRTPENTRRDAGRYSFQFDASGLSSGTYIYIITFTPDDGSKELRLTRKLTVMK